MNILILDPDVQRRRALCEALGLIDETFTIHEAREQLEADRALQSQGFDLVLIGPDLEMGLLLTLMYMRRRLPKARLVVVNNLSTQQNVFQEHLTAAGCDLVISGHYASWKMADLLHPLLGDTLPLARRAPARHLVSA